MTLKRIAGGALLLLAMIVFILAGHGPFEEPAGLALALIIGAVFSVLGGLLIGKSFLDQGDS